MLVTLLVIVMYFCYRCCQRDEKKATHLLKWTIAILSLLSCCAVGAGFYGNEETHKGLQRFLDAAQDIQETTNRTNLQVIGVEKNLNETVLIGIDELQKLIERNNSKYSAINRHLTLATRAADRVITYVLDMSAKVNRVDFDYLDGLARAYGFHRWLVMVLLLSWLMVLFVILLFAIGKASKLIMLIFGILSLVSLILCWLSAGFHLGVSVGLGDFCTAPNDFFLQLGNEQIDKDIINYYINCDPKAVDNPFKMAFPNTYDSIKVANSSFTDALTNVKQSNHPTDSWAREDLKMKTEKVYNGLDEAIQTLIHLNALVECTNLHKSYIDAIKGICLHGLNGLVFLMVSIMLAGLFFTALILLASGSWKSLTRGRDKIVLKACAGTSEDDGPFLLQPESSTPSYYSFLPGCRAPLGEQMPLRKHVTPPPAFENHTMPPGYSGGEANHQNVNLAHLHDGSL